MRRAIPIVVATWLCAASATAQDETASLSGLVRDLTGAPIPRANADLTAARDHVPVLQTVTDGDGRYRFGDLSPGDYKLRLQAPGFQTLSVKSIRIGPGQHGQLPPLQMNVGIGCPPNSLPAPDYIAFLDKSGPAGDISGRVRRMEKRFVENSPPIAGATITLVCPDAKPCAETTSDAEGNFLFTNIAPGPYSLRVRSPMYYPETEPGYEVQAGVRSSYGPIYMESCHRKTCDPQRRPKKPLGHCE